MASVKDTASFFVNGNSKQFDYVLKLYPQVLKLKAEKRTKKPDELIQLDDWYQNELPKRIKQRGRDAHLSYEELVKTMKWKQTRGKFYPQLSYLIKVNTPRAVMQETKKAFRKLPNLEQALTALSNLKGVGTTMASALLAAAAPESVPFMADECLMAIPEIEGIDYTTKEYLNFVQHIQTTVTRLNDEKDNNNSSWSAHRVELAIWTHYVANELQPELLEGLPYGNHYVTNGNTTTTTTTTAPVNAATEITTITPPSPPPPQQQQQQQQQQQSPITTPSSTVDTTETTQQTALSTIQKSETTQTTTITTTINPTTNTTSLSVVEQSDESNLDPPAASNGVLDSLDESTRSEDSLEKSITPIVANDETNDSDSQSSAKRSLDCESSESQTELSEPETKKLKNTEN